MLEINSRKTWAWIGALSTWLFVILEIFTERWFSSHLEDYNWLLQSISFLGHEGSPVEQQVKVWGILFFLFMATLGLGLYHTYKPNKWAYICGLLLLLYGLGEGLGSGLFPPNAPDLPYSTKAFYHDLFSGIGDLGLILLPFGLFGLFPKIQYPLFNKFLWMIIVAGLVMLSFFLLSKFIKPQEGFLMYKGLWQRLYMLNYCIFLLILSFKMIR